MANNHGTDYGQAGLDQTLADDQGRAVPGGRHRRERRPGVHAVPTEIKGQRITVFGVSQVIDGPGREPPRSGGVADGQATSRGCRRHPGGARADSDTIVVYLHWGVEGDTCPEARARRTPRNDSWARAPTSWSGATPTVRRARAASVPAFVDYGLGNFIWYNESGVSGTSGVLLVTVTGRDTDATVGSRRASRAVCRRR